MTYYMYFIQTLIIGCTVSEILAEIDHKGPNWTFRTLKMTFRVIQYLSYYRGGWMGGSRIRYSIKKLVLIRDSVSEISP